MRGLYPALAPDSSREGRWLAAGRLVVRRETQDAGRTRDGTWHPFTPALSLSVTNSLPIVHGCGTGIRRGFRAGAGRLKAGSPVPTGLPRGGRNRQGRGFPLSVPHCVQPASPRPATGRSAIIVPKGWAVAGIGDPGNAHKAPPGIMLHLVRIRATSEIRSPKAFWAGLADCEKQISRGNE